MGPWPRMQMQREHGPFLHGPCHQGCLALHFCIPRNLWLFFTFSFISCTRNLGLSWWSSPVLFQLTDIHFPMIPVGPAPRIIFVSFHLGRDCYKVLHSLLKCVSLISFLFTFFFLFILNLKKIIQHVYATGLLPLFLPSLYLILKITSKFSLT